MATYLADSPIGDLIGVGLIQDYLGRELQGGEVATAMSHLRASADAVHAYTRGRGFDPTNPQVVTAPALLGLIVARAVRTMLNPSDLQSFSVSGVSQKPGRGNWTLAEIRTLDDFRLQASSFRYMAD